MLKPARKPGGREDHPQYVLGAVREAIVNAVAHRDYSISGSKIRLFLFADRLELYSPGALPNTLTVETMPYRVFTRNQLLVSFLSRMNSRRTGLSFLESRGEGGYARSSRRARNIPEGVRTLRCSARSCDLPSGRNHRHTMHGRTWHKRSCRLPSAGNRAEGRRTVLAGRTKTPDPG